MAMQWLNVTPRMKEGLRIVEATDTGKFRLLVKHICQGLKGSKDSTDSMELFSSEEKEKLSASFDLNSDDLRLLLESVTLIFKRAAYNAVSAASFESVVNTSLLDISEAKASIFVNAWNTYGKEIVRASREKSLFPLRVKDVHWSLNAELSSSGISKDSKPLALVQFALTGEETSKLTVQLDRTGLIELYNTLETVQSQLDNLK